MEYVLRTNSLTKIYKHTEVVSKVNMNVEKGDIYGFIGENGAGKTTVMKMICGLAKPNIGTIELFGSTDCDKSRKRIGNLIEQPALYPGLSARQNLIYYSKILGLTDYKYIDEVLDYVGLANTDKKSSKKFSLGMKQRLSIAVSLLGHPDMLILDEPINGLDPKGIKEVRELLIKLNEEQHITIVISSHILGELSKLSTKYGVINKGKMIDEFSAADLEDRCKKCLKINVDDVKKATWTIDNIVHSNDYKVFNDNTICIFDKINEPGKINSDLVTNGVIVSGLQVAGEDLESYFMEMMGGN